MTLNPRHLHPPWHLIPRATFQNATGLLLIRPTPLFEKERDLCPKTLIAHVSDGRPGYALRLLKDESALEFRAECLTDLGGMLTSTHVQKFKYAEKLAKDKDAMRQMLLVWLSYWRDVLLQTIGAATPIANIDQAERITSLAQTLSLEQARRVTQEMESALERLDCNVNARLLADRKATEQEIEEAALQYVRKVSGYRKPSRLNQEAFEAAVAEVALATEKLLDQLPARKSIA